MAENKIREIQCFSYSDKYFLSVKYEGNDEPEQGARHCLRELGRVSPHVPNDKVEGEDVVADAVAAVKQDTVHAGVEKRLTLPQLLDINDNVEEGEEDEGKTGGDKDE